MAARAIAGQCVVHLLGPSCRCTAACGASAAPGDVWTSALQPRGSQHPCCSGEGLPTWTHADMVTGKDTAPTNPPGEDVSEHATSRDFLPVVQKERIRTSCPLTPWGKHLSPKAHGPVQTPNQPCNATRCRPWNRPCSQTIKTSTNASLLSLCLLNCCGRAASPPQCYPSPPKDETVQNSRVDSGQ